VCASRTLALLSILAAAAGSPRGGSAGAGALADAVREGLAAAFSAVGDLCRRSGVMTGAFVGAGALLHVLRAVLRGVTAAPPGSTEFGAVASAAAGALSAMAIDGTHGGSVKEAACDLLDAAFASQGAFERKADGMLKFFGADHTDRSSGRNWTAPARSALLAFLDGEIGALDAHVATVGVDSWSGAAPRWDPRRTRNLHPAPIDPASLRPASAAGGAP
jgi:hypothetical protein